MKERITAIILMAGVGKRMNSDVPKQYIMVKDKPIIYYTIKAFEESNIDDIVLVTGKDDVEYCKNNIVRHFGFQKIIKVVAGGKERYNSVYNGLEAIDESSYVLIHDGARPCINKNQINHMIDKVKENKACIMGVQVKDTIKIVDDNDNIIDSPDRAYIWQAQTPQAFEFNIIKKAYKHIIDNVVGCKVTDDAAVWCMYTNEPVKMIMGTYENIKVTTPYDMEIVVNYIEKP